MLIVELYPWHSAHVTAATHPPTDVLNHFVWEPLAERAVTSASTGHGGMPPTSSVWNSRPLSVPAGWTTAPPFRPAPHVSTRRQAGTSSWSNGTLEARPAQSERSPIPAPRDLHAIRPAAHHTVSIGAALRGCALYTYEFLFGRSTNQRIYRTCGMADVFWAARTPMACRSVTAGYPASHRCS